MFNPVWAVRRALLVIVITLCLLALLWGAAEARWPFADPRPLVVIGLVALVIAIAGLLCMELWMLVVDDSGWGSQRFMLLSVATGVVIATSGIGLCLLGMMPVESVDAASKTAVQAAGWSRAVPLVLRLLVVVLGAAHSALAWYFVENDYTMFGGQWLKWLLVAVLIAVAAAMAALCLHPEILSQLFSFTETNM